MKALEKALEWGGTKRDVVFLILSGIALIVSLFDLAPLPFDAAWIAIVLCGVPIVLEAVVGLVTAFDIKADVLVSIALIASILIGEHFAAGEVAVIMQLGALLEDLTVAKARAGIEKLVHLTPRTARRLRGGAPPFFTKQLRNLTKRLSPFTARPENGRIMSGESTALRLIRAALPRNASHHRRFRRL